MTKGVSSELSQGASSSRKKSSKVLQVAESLYLGATFIANHLPPDSRVGWLVCDLNLLGWMDFRAVMFLKKQRRGSVFFAPWIRYLRDPDTQLYP
jgi:hypothetical protein